MTVPVFCAAKHLGERSGWSKSNLEMQKLLYIAHMFHLGIHRKPLVLGHFEAWDYGPVHPTLYHKIKIFESDPVENIFRSEPNISEGTESGLIDDIVEELSDSNSSRLVAITHTDKGAWAKNYIPGQRGITIPDEDILEEYKERVQRTKQGR